MRTPASYAPRAPPPERTTPTREENTAGLRLEAIRARNSWRRVLNSAMAAALRALLLLVLCGIQQAKHNPPADKNLPATVLLLMQRRVNSARVHQDCKRFRSFFAVLS